MIAPKPILCRHCRQPLAQATPTRLSFGDQCYCESRVTLHCSSCGAQRLWVPRQHIDETAQMCYAEPELVAA